MEMNCEQSFSHQYHLLVIWVRQIENCDCSKSLLISSFCNITTSPHCFGDVFKYVFNSLLFLESWSFPKGKVSLNYFTFTTLNFLSHLRSIFRTIRGVWQLLQLPTDSTLSHALPLAWTRWIQLLVIPGHPRAGACRRCYGCEGPTWKIVS